MFLRTESASLSVCTPETVPELSLRRGQHLSSLDVVSPNEAKKQAQSPFSQGTIQRTGWHQTENWVSSTQATSFTLSSYLNLRRGSALTLRFALQQPSHASALRYSSLHFLAPPSPRPATLRPDNGGYYQKPPRFAKKWAVVNEVQL